MCQSLTDIFSRVNTNSSNKAQEERQKNIFCGWNGHKQTLMPRKLLKKDNICWGFCFLVDDNTLSSLSSSSVIIRRTSWEAVLQLLLKLQFQLHADSLSEMKLSRWWWWRQASRRKTKGSGMFGASMDIGQPVKPTAALAKDESDGWCRRTMDDCDDSWLLPKIFSSVES